MSRQQCHKGWAKAARMQSSSSSGSAGTEVTGKEKLRWEILENIEREHGTAVRRRCDEEKGRR